MSASNAGSCRENGLFGFISKLLGKSLPKFIRKPRVEATSEEIIRQRETLQQTLWDDKSELYAERLREKGLTADPAAAYGLFGFMGARYNQDGTLSETGSPLTLKLTGKFPKAQYMSLQIYRGKPFQTSDDVGPVLSDFNIAPKPGGNNPFQTGIRDDEGEFEIIITPDESKKKNTNHIWYEPQNSPSDSAAITGFYRVYLPEGEKITTADLPTIEAFDSDDNPVQAEYVDLVDSWYLTLPNPVSLAINEMTPALETLPWLNLDCLPKLPQRDDELSGLGASQDLQYVASFSKVAVGEIVVIKFRAPAVYFGPLGNADAPPAVRYWSICSTYYPALRTMNSLPCKPDQLGERDVILVFGKESENPDNPTVIEDHAKSLGAEFLPDDRPEHEEVLTFLMRNILATPAHNPRVFKGPFAPTGKVYTTEEFLSLQEL